MTTRDLEPAFRATTYRVTAAAARFDLRIARPDRAFEAFLAERGVGCWAIVTACNPGGQPSNGNDDRMKRLAARIAGLGLTALPTLHLADAGDWPDEPGFLILGADPALARRLAAEFGQLASVVGSAGGAPRLWWTRTE